eukprot:c20956_g1_i2 orf=401-619(+)
MFSVSAKKILLEWVLLGSGDLEWPRDLMSLSTNQKGGSNLRGRRQISTRKTGLTTCKARMHHMHYMSACRLS